MIFCLNCGGELEEKSLKHDKAIVHCPECGQYYRLEKTEFTEW